MVITTVIPEPTSRRSPGNPEPLSAAEQRDRELAALIERAVSHETQRGVRDLRVEVVGDEVRLSGSCGTYYIKQKAQHAAMLLHRHGSLTNRIHVR